MTTKETYSTAELTTQRAETATESLAAAQHEYAEASANVEKMTTAELKDLIEKIQTTKKVEEQVKLWKNIMDDKGIDGLIGLIEGGGDIAIGVVSTAFWLIQAERLGFSMQDKLKIIAYHIVDGAVGSVPILGSALDFLMLKSNKWSAKIFEKNIEKLKKEAQAKGISTEQWDEVAGDTDRFIAAANKVLGARKKVYGKRKAGRAV